MTNIIYCDESGFTGNDLFSLDQPYFVYSSINIDPEDALSTTEKVLRDFKIHSTELKGKNLLKTENGKKAITYILEKHVKKSLLIAHEKKYVLAGKCFEYIFEPVLSAHNSYFYNIRFHRFISNLIYLHFYTNQEHTDKLLLDFQSMMRQKNIEQFLGVITDIKADKNVSPFLLQIADFFYIHKKTIADELNLLQNDDPTGTWILELSMMSLFSLLCSWGECKENMVVYFDESKPLVTQVDVFTAMIARKDRQYIDFEGTSYPITFSLQEEIHKANSKDFPGIQIADIFASAYAFLLKYPNDDNLRYWNEICKDSLHTNSVFPQLGYCDLDTEQGFVNAALLAELVNRSLSGDDLFMGLSIFKYQMELSFYESLFSLRRV